MTSGIYKYEPLWQEWYIDELIGKGSYGEVYKIHRDVNGKREEAAAKYISIPKSEDRKSYRQYTDRELETLFEERADKFMIEISSMNKLRNSAHVVRYEAHIKEPKENEVGWDIIIRMELLQSLEDYLDENSFSRKDVVKLGIDICSAIESCQANDIIHRDIKIENIFIDPTGKYKLGDFGVSKVGSGTATGTVTGTEDYMAPEISQEHKYNKTVDIYALGIAMYQLLNNRRKPFIDADSVPGQDAEAQAHLKRIKGEKMPSPKYADEDLSAIVLKACAFNRNERYSSPKDMAGDLKKVLTNLSDEPIMEARGRKGYKDESNPSNGATETDIPVRKDTGTVTDIPGGKSKKDGTITDIHMGEEKKKKSKIPLFVGLGVACLVLIACIVALLPKNIKITSIENIPEEVIQLVVGDTYELKPEILPENSTSKLIFASENELLAVVDENGVITAVESGEVKVKIQGDAVTEYVSLNIANKKVQVEDIIGIASTAELIVGSSTTVTAKVQPENATVQQITYSSSDSNVATIGSDGVITAVSVGQVTITASADGVTKEMSLGVKAKETPKPQTDTNTSNNSNSSKNSSGKNNYTPPKNDYTPPKNDYTPPANNTPAVNNNPPANSNTGSNNQSGGGSSGREIANPDGDRYY